MIITLLAFLATSAAAAIPATPLNPSPGSTSSPGPTQGSTNVTLGWSAASGSTYYSVAVRNMNTNVLVVDTTTTNTSYTASLSGGTPYRWNVAACNASGCSSYTTPLYFQTPTIVSLPSAPQNLSASSGNAQVSLAWSAPSSNGGATITSYRVFRGTNSSNTLIVTSGGCANLGASLGCTDTGLTNGQSYYYIVSAVNSLGQGPASNGVTATPVAPASVPGSFTLTANPYCNTNPPGASPAVLLNWSASSGVVTYTLYRNGGAVSGNGTNMPTSQLTFDNNANVTAGTSYLYFVRATNASGSTDSNTVTANVPANVCSVGATIPGAPTNLSAFGGNGQVSLGWNAPSSNGGAVITTYRVFRGTSSSNTLIVTSGGCANLGASLGCTDTGLTNGQSYYYIVSAVNSVGQGSASNGVTATPVAPASVPGSFTLSANPYCNTNPPGASPAVLLNWGPSSGVVTYTLYRNGGAVSGNGTNMPAAQLTFDNNANVAAGTTYNYFVRATNNTGSTDSNTISVVVPANVCVTGVTIPGPPTNLAASPGNAQVTLAWSAPSSNGGAAISSYRVFRGTNSSNTLIVTSGGCANLGATLSCPDTGFTNGQSYYYIVSAVNSVGQGPPSNGVTAMPVAIPDGTCAINCIATVASVANVGDVVHFAATSNSSNCGSQTPTYTWTFGDGTSDVAASASHAYFIPGPYTWALTTTIGDQTCIKSGVISIQSNCTLSCSADVQPTATVGAAVLFSAKAMSTSCAEVPIYNWTFGDGTTVIGATPTHSYGSSGVFNWRLTIAAGATTCVRNGTISITAQTSPSPAIDSFRASRDQIAQGGTSDLSWVVRNAIAVTLEGYGNVPAASGTTVQPSETTTYKLIAMNNSGSQTASITILVDPALTIAATTDRATVTPTSDVVLTASARGGIPPYRYTWSIGGEGAQLVHRFATSGQYAVTCSVTDAHGTLKTSAPVYVSVAFVTNTLRLRPYDATEGQSPRDVVTVSADGRARVEIRATSAQPGNVTLVMVDDSGRQVPVSVSSADMDGGFVDAGKLAGAITRTLALNNGAYEASATYQSPDDFNPLHTVSAVPDRPLRFKATFIGKDGGIATSDLLNLTLVRPPVVLLHGLWSDPTTWSTFSSLLPTDRFRRRALRWDGTGHLAGALAQVYGPDGGGNILSLLKDMRNGGMSVARIDVVAHSMGGLVARALSVDHPELIHKLITIDTPHYGSKFANWLRDNPSLKAQLAAKLLGKSRPIDAGAVDDLRAGSAERQNLTGKSTVHAHSIVGVSSAHEPCASAPETLVAVVCLADPLVYAPLIGSSLYAYCLRNFSTEILGEPNDEIVGVSSQLGGLPLSSGVTTRHDGCGFVHTAITSSSEVAEDVARLLDTSINDPEAFGTLEPPTRSQSLSSSKVMAVALPATAIGKFSISTPTEGAQFSPLSKIVLRTIGLPADTQRLIVVGANLVASSDQAPFDVTFDVPATAIGEYSIQAFALTKDAYAESESLTIFVTADATVQTILCDPNRLLLTAGSTARVYVSGYFSDGVTRDIASTTSYRTLNPLVATVDATGSVHAVTAGTTILHLQNGQAQSDVEITVESTLNRGRAVKH